MRYEVILAPGAVPSLRELPASLRAAVRDGLERRLRLEPAKVSRSRIKSLRGIRRPQYRLRVGDVRVFYDVTETEVAVLAIVSKEEAQAWLAEWGEGPEEGGPGRG